MKKALGLVLILPLLLAASYRTANFVCTAPTPDLARQCAECAERARRDVALAWLGQELSPWPEPCPITVKVTTSSGGGATSFGFDRNRVVGQSMTVEGRPDKILSCVLPHEVTHCVFAWYFKAPSPRWCDEGSAVCSEDAEELARQDRMCREILNTPGRKIPLARLFALREYPSDVMVLYAEGYSVTSWLIGLKGRQEFLQFVYHGQERSWDEAVRVCYGYDSVNALEGAWLQHMKATKQAPQPAAGGAARSSEGPAAAAGSPAARTTPADPSMIRDLAPPAAPPATINQTDTAKILLVLADNQKQIAATQARLVENDRRQDQRLDALERRNSTPPPQSWNDVPQRTAPQAPPQPAVRQLQPVYAQPFAAPASVCPGRQ